MVMSNTAMRTRAKPRSVLRLNGLQSEQVTLSLFMAPLPRPADAWRVGPAPIAKADAKAGEPGLAPLKRPPVEISRIAARLVDFGEDAEGGPGAVGEDLRICPLEPFALGLVGRISPPVFPVHFVVSLDFQ